MLSRKIPKTLSGIETVGALVAIGINVALAGKYLKPYQGLKLTSPVGTANTSVVPENT